jgi:hypothetical protein
MTNKYPKYYSEVGSYQGAIKLDNRWQRAKNLNYLSRALWIRWQGPPSKAIIKALNGSNIIDAKELQEYWSSLKH